MSQLFQGFATPRQGQPSTAYEFNGTTAYVSIPSWQPLGSEYVIEATGGTVALDGIPQWMVAGDNDSFSLGFLANETWVGRFLNSSLVPVNNDSGVPVIQQIVTLIQTISPINSILSVNGVDFQNNSLPAGDGSQNPITSIAALNTPLEFFDGPVWNVRLTDNAPIQNTFTTASNGVRVCNIPNDVFVPEADLFESRLAVIHGPDPLTGFVDLVGHTSNPSRVRIYGSTHATFPNQFAGTGSSGEEFRFQAPANLQVGQHFRLTLNNNDSGVLIMKVDNVVLPVVNTPVSLGSTVVNQLGGSVNAGPLPIGWTISGAFIRNNSTGDTWVYLLNEGTGNLAENIGTTASSATDYDGVWTDTLGKVFIADNSRFYPIDEGTGTVIFDKIGGNNGTLIGGVETDWINAGVRIDDFQAQPFGFDQGLPMTLGALGVDSIGAITHFHQGIPFTDFSRVAVTIEGPVNRIASGPVPFDINGRVVLTLANPPASFISSVPYDVAGRIVSRVLVIPSAITPLFSYDASLPTNMFQDVGGTIAVVDGDPVGNFDGLTNTGGTDRPIWNDWLNGLGMIRFDGVDDYLRGLGVLTMNAASYSIFLVMRIITPGSFQGLAEVYNQPTTDFTDLKAHLLNNSQAGDGRIESYRSNNIDPAQDVISDSDTSSDQTGNVIILEVGVDSVSQVARIFINGFQQGANDGFSFSLLGNITATDMLIACRYFNGLVDFSNYDFGEYQFYDTALTSNQLDQIRSELQTKWLASFLYDPIETSPNWSIINGTNTWESTINVGIETVTIDAPGSDNNSIAFRTINAANVEVSSDIQYLGAGVGSASFLNAVRIVDGNNFVGWRTYQGVTQVYERIAGVFTQVRTGGGGNFPQAQIGSKVTLRVVGDVLTMTINGVDYVNDVPLVWLTVGRVGAIPRAWGVGRQTVFSNFQAIDLT